MIDDDKWWYMMTNDDKWWYMIARMGLKFVSLPLYQPNFPPPGHHPPAAPDPWPLGWGWPIRHSWGGGYLGLLGPGSDLAVRQELGKCWLATLKAGRCAWNSSGKIQKDDRLILVESGWFCQFQYPGISTQKRSKYIGERAKAFNGPMDWNAVLMFSSIAS